MHAEEQLSARVRARESEGERGEREGEGERVETAYVKVKR
jgi:hypothetical protein